MNCWDGWKLETGNECQQGLCFDEGTSIAERALVGMTSALKEFVAASGRAAVRILRLTSRSSASGLSNKRTCWLRANRAISGEKARRDNVDDTPQNYEEKNDSTQ